jgi:hypothetical protein
MKIFAHLFPKKTRTIDDEITRLLEEIAHIKVEDKAYNEALDNLSVLTKANGQNKTTSILSADSVLMAVTSILGTLLVLNHENLHVITSKAFSSIVKPRM